MFLIFVDFPFGCRFFYGLHTLVCYQTIWNMTDCSQEGFAFPKSTDILRRYSYSSYDIL